MKKKLRSLMLLYRFGKKCPELKFSDITREKYENHMDFANGIRIFCDDLFTHDIPGFGVLVKSYQDADISWITVLLQLINRQFELPDVIEKGTLLHLKSDNADK